MLRLLSCLFLVGFFATAAWAEPAANSNAQLGITSALFAAPAEAEETAEPAASTRFGEDTFSFQSYGSASLGTRGDLYLAHVGAGWYFIEGLSINLEAVGGAASVETALGNDEEDGAAYGFDLLFRWHFIREANWSLYADGGAGMLWTHDPFPAGGTHQNFTPQFGFGVTVALTDEINLMGGARWHHVSNASRTGNNPGADGIMIYAGIMIPF